MNIFKFIKSLFLALVLGFVALSAQNPDSSEYPPDIKRILDRKVLKVGLIGGTNEFPFFFLDKDEKLTGLDIDLAKGIAKDLGVEVEFDRSAKSYQGVVDLVKEKKVDLGISLLSGTMERAKKSKFTDPYITLYTGLLVNRKKFSDLDINKTFYKRLDSKDAVIGYLEHSAYFNFAKNLFKHAKLIGYPTQRALMEEVKKGNLTAGLVDEKEVKTFPIFNPNDILFIETVEIRDFQDPICIFVNKNDEQLFFFVNTFLSRWPKLNFNELIQKYYTPEAHE